jgi:cyanophycinase
MRRRELLLTSLLGAAALPVAARNPPRGRLVIVGGAEDRMHDRLILRRFMEYAGGPGARIRLITAASSVPDDVGESYMGVFSDLGATDCQVLPLTDRESAFAPELRAEILQANAVFMSGGDQSRLMAAIWETPVLAALHQANQLRSCCIGGTSAGAAVMSRHMIAQGPALFRPRKDMVQTDIGLGFLPAAIVDQHFSQRRRLARLLSALAVRPDLLGVGIDEDTALVVDSDVGVEVIGNGVVTLVDPSSVRTNAAEAPAEGMLEMLGVQLHTLPAGHRYPARPTGQPVDWPAGLRRAIQRLVQRPPLRV